MKMKLKICVSLVTIFLLLMAGCSTSPVPYSFTPNDPNSPTINFVGGSPGVAFVSFAGQLLPEPEGRTHWDPISFPAGRELRLVVYAAYSTSSRTTLSGFGVLGAAVNVAQDVRAVSRNVDVEIEFICPPLQAGRRYQLYFTKGPGMPGTNTLTLIDLETRDVIRQQDFEVVFGGDEVR